MKKIIISLLMILVVISICSCTSNNTVDDTVMEISAIELDAWGLEEGRTFSVVIDNDGLYHVDINGREIVVQIEKDYNLENAKSNITECDSEIKEIARTSKEKVVNYINDSKILEDKEELVEYINNIPVLMADFANSEVAEYDLESDSIFINNENRVDVCEWLIVHELVYALSQKTNGTIEKGRYQDDLFNEVLTDIITAGIEPNGIEVYESEYFAYHGYVYLYLGCVGIDGIEAYFYGYDEILEKIPEAELDIFVESLKYVNDSEDAVIIVCNCINDWGLEK